MDPRMYPGGLRVHEISVDVGSVGANGTATATVPVPGVKLGKDAVAFVNPAASLDAGVGFCGAVITGDGQVELRFINTTAGAVNPAAATYIIGVTNYKSVR